MTKKVTSSPRSDWADAEQLAKLDCLRNWYQTDKKQLPGGGPQAAPDADYAFKFVVIGDLHNRVELAKPQIQAINHLAPDLVLHVGDLIMGVVPGEWDEAEQLLRAFQMPVVMAPGNHDIVSASSRKIYEQRYGPTYFSFDYKGVHFIILDSVMHDNRGVPLGRIDSRQLGWLKNDLASNGKVRAKFLFLHQPFWSNTGPTRAFQREHWVKDVHPLLAQHHVSAVFAGHVHRFMKFAPLDGVHYYISGAGATTLAQNPAEGDFLHSCLISLRNGCWKVGVIRPGAIIAPDNMVYYENHQTPNVLRSVEVRLLEIGCGTDSNPIQLNLTNTLNKPIEVTAEPLSDPKSLWKITPQTQSIPLAAGQKGGFVFNATIDDLHKQYPAPCFAVNIVGAEKTAVSTQVNVPIKAFRTACCHKADQPPKIDGKLKDPIWQKCSVLSPFFDPTAQHQTRFETEVRLSYDPENLYLAFRCHEPHLQGLIAKAGQLVPQFWFDDLIEIFLDPKLDQQSYYHLAFNANTVMYSVFSKRRCKWDPQCTAQSGREAAAWTLEVGLPWSSLGSARVKPGARIGLQLVRNRAQHPTECTQWSPTFGGNHVPEQFGRMILE